ncbi:type II toxin-antitoxin system PemK/MazF family toxin [Mycobacterium branderi]
MKIRLHRRAKVIATPLRLLRHRSIHRFQLYAPRGSRGHEQSGSRYAIGVQSDQLPLSMWLVAPTSTSARPASFRPEVEIGGVNTRVLAEPAAAIDPGRRGKSVGVPQLRRDAPR